MLRGDGGGKVAPLRRIEREAVRVAPMMLAHARAVGRLDILPLRSTALRGW